MELAWRPAPKPWCLRMQMLRQLTPQPLPYETTLYVSSYCVSLGLLKIWFSNVRFARARKRGLNSSRIFRFGIPCHRDSTPRRLRFAKQTAARPKNGRPLQNQLPTKHDGFVAAVPSLVFRDGTEIFLFDLSRE